MKEDGTSPAEMSAMSYECITSIDLPKHHQNGYPNRETQCTHCGQSGKYLHDSTDDLEQCLDIKIDCPNKDYNARLKRKNLKDHCHEYGKEAINCEYTDHGCKLVCLREDMHQHNTQQVSAHL